MIDFQLKVIKLGKIRYGERIHRTNVLGPYERSAIWVHGCCFSCEGCIGEHYKHGSYSEGSPEELAQWFLQDDEINHLTLSGGEPMLQAEALSSMIREIRNHRDIGVIVYTGFTYESLKEKSREDEDIRNFLDCIDLLVDGPYVEKLDNNRPYIGSTNQNIILLTDLYSDVYKDYYYGAEGRQVELIFQKNKTMLVGVPGKEQREMWLKIKKMGENK